MSAALLAAVLLAALASAPAADEKPPEDPQARPVITGRRGVVTSLHPLSSMAGMRILMKGGNAFDAAVASALATSVVDPKNFDPRSFVDFEGDVCVIPPNSFALARTVEYFRIPRNVVVATLGKSTYARCGIIVNVTPLEPEWEGIVTLEVSNTTPLPAKIYANEGIAQMLFFESDEECEVSYADKKGKYQGQKSLTLPKL